MRQLKLDLFAKWGIAVAILAILIWLTLLALSARGVELPKQSILTNAPVVISVRTNTVVWHDLRPQTNRIWLAKPKKGKEQAAINAIGKIGKNHKHLKHVGIIRFESGEHNPKAKLNGLVEYVVPDRTVKVQGVVPNDPLWSQQWDMAKIQMPQAWGLTTGTTNVIVAVIDTGVDYTHPDLAANLWTNPTNGTHGYQCFAGNLAEGGAEQYGHGTHCAGTIAAVGNNGVGMAGINWRLKIVSMAFLNQYGSGQDSDAIMLMDKLVELRRAGQNIVVASDSWGGFGENPALVDAFQAFEEAGILSCCAAGNSGLNIDREAVTPAGMTNRGIISVLASDSSDVVADFSDYGLVNTDIAAPGVNTLSTLSMNTNLPISSSTGYGALSGTSMATPHVAGVAALIKGLHPELSVYQLKDLILNRASYDSIDFGTGQFSTTSGRLNAYKSLTNQYIGRTNSAPVVYPSAISNMVGGASGTISFTARDNDNDPLRYALFESTGIFPFAAANSVSFTAPHYAFSIPILAYEEASDRNGGGDLKKIFSNVIFDQSYSTQRYEIVLRSNYVDRLDVEFGEEYLTNSNPNILAWRTAIMFCGANGSIGGLFNSGHPHDPVGPNDYIGQFVFPDNSEWNAFVVAQNDELTIKQTPPVAFRFGSKTNSTHPFPNLVCRFDKSVGQAPLTVNYDFSGTITTNGPYQFYTWDVFSDSQLLGTTGSFTLDVPGVKNVTFAVADALGYTDAKTVIFSVLAPPQTNQPPPPPPPTNSLSQVTNLFAADLGHSANLTWADNSTGEDRYLLEASRKKMGFWSVVTTVQLPSNSQSYLYTPGQGGSYRFRVRAALGLTFSPWSAYSNSVKL